MMATRILWQPQPEPPDTVSPGSILEDPAHSRVADLLPMSYTTRGTCTSWTKHTLCLDVTSAEMQHRRLQTRAKGSTKSQACLYALISKAEIICLHGSVVPKHCQVSGPHNNILENKCLDALMTAVKQCNRLFFHDTFWNIWGFKQLFDLN